MCSEECGTKSFLNAIFPDHNKGKDVYYQGSRQMTSASRRYYEKELGAGVGPSPGMEEMFGYTEPLRRFIQREGFEPQANEIPNTMPSWMPGEDYYTDFHKGDPYIKVDQGFARLPGAGYAALHPELEDVNPETTRTPTNESGHVRGVGSQCDRIRKDAPQELCQLRMEGTRSPRAVRRSPCRRDHPAGN